MEDKNYNQEETNNEDSVYWYDRALFSLNRLQKVLKENNIVEPNLPFWNPYNSWKIIFLKTEDCIGAVEQRIREQKTQNLEGE